MKSVLHVVVFLTIATMVCTPSASAQLSFGGGPHVGFSFSSFPKAVKDYYGMGLTFGAHGDLNIIKFVTVRLKFDYNTFSSDKDKIASQIAAGNNVPASDLKMEGLNAGIIVIGIDGLGKIPTGSIFTPYGILGLNMNFLSVSDPKLLYRGQDVTNQVFGKTQSETKFGINFGAGGEIKFGLVKAFLEIKYALIFTSGEGTNHLPITLGVSFGG